MSRRSSSSIFCLAAISFISACNPIIVTIVAIAVVVSVVGACSTSLRFAPRGVPGAGRSSEDVRRLGLPPSAR